MLYESLLLCWLVVREYSNLSLCTGKAPIPSSLAAAPAGDRTEPEMPLLAAEENENRADRSGRVIIAYAAIVRVYPRRII